MLCRLIFRIFNILLILFCFYVCLIFPCRGVDNFYNDAESNFSFVESVKLCIQELLILLTSLIIIGGCCLHRQHQQHTDDVAHLYRSPAGKSTEWWQPHGTLPWLQDHALLQELLRRRGKGQHGHLCEPTYYRLRWDPCKFNSRVATSSISGLVHIWKRDFVLKLVEASGVRCESMWCSLFSLH